MKPVFLIVLSLAALAAGAEYAFVRQNGERRVLTAAGVELARGRNRIVLKLEPKDVRLTGCE